MSDPLQAGEPIRARASVSTVYVSILCTFDIGFLKSVCFVLCATLPDWMHTQLRLLTFSWWEVPPSGNDIPRRVWKCVDPIEGTASSSQSDRVGFLEAIICMGRRSPPNEIRKKRATR